MVYPEKVQLLADSVAKFHADLQAYQSKGNTNAAQAARLRKQSLILTASLKQFRADSVAAHKKS